MNAFTIAYIKALLNNFFENDQKKVNEWLKTENPFLGNTTPEFMIKVGREEKLLEFIKASLKESSYRVE